MRRTDYQPPIVYFGGKSGVARVVWDALGSPLNYVEPFFGSGAVLFLRPGGAGHIETVNDADGLLVNFWRALQYDSDAVAEYADWPVTEADLHARHIWLLGEREQITDRLCGTTGWYDAKAAGWWAWGINCWIGSGWCRGDGPWTSVDGVMTLRNPGQGVNRKLPHLGDPGKGDDSATPASGRPRKGRQPETPVGTCEERREWLKGYLRRFADRLRHVRVCCGDWSRVCGPSVTYRHGVTGVFIDPPYADTANRTANLYANDCEQVAHGAREWAVKEGDNPLMRIVLCGYEGEHAMPDNWHCHEWQSVGGYGLIGDDEETGGAGKSTTRAAVVQSALRQSRVAFVCLSFGTARRGPRYQG